MSDNGLVELGDYARRRRALADSIAAKTAHLRRLRAVADANGHITEEGYRLAADPEPPPEAA